MTWVDDAACSPGTARLFEVEAAPADHLAAAAICGRCPVLADCRDYRATNRLTGVFGGVLFTVADRGEPITALGVRIRERDRARRQPAQLETAHG